MHLPATSQQLLENATSEKLYADLIVQLNKDFALANLAYELPLACSPTTLKSALEKILLELLEHNYDGYLNLIYRVDVAESDLISLKNDSLNELSEQLTYLILKRIYKKVWFRNRL